MLEGQREEDSGEVFAHELHCRIPSTPLEIASTFVDLAVLRLTHHCMRPVHSTSS